MKRQIYIQDIILVIMAILFVLAVMTSCSTGSYTTKNKTCNGKGWYAKDKNLGPKNKPIKNARRW